MNSPCVFRFIRTSTASDATDDIARINRVSPGLFKVTYTTPHTVHSRMNRSTLFLNEVDTLSWLKRTLNLIRYDVDPFECLQVDFPTMPSVLYSLKKDYGYYYDVMDAMEFHLKHCESLTRKVETAEDEMPPLVPMTPPRVRRQLF